MNPYQTLPPMAFWRTAVAEPDPHDIGPLWTPKFTVGPDEPILTAGSCFARHLGRALLEHGLNWYDTEPAPPGLTEQQREAGGYGAFSFRTGNIYTAATLWQWLAWATGASTPPAEVWAGEASVHEASVDEVADGHYYYDPYRPGLAGEKSPAAVLAARATTLAAIRRGISGAGCLMFTLGLTEAWRDRADRTTYPACPGTVRGRFDPDRHEFHNFTFAEIYDDLADSIALLRSVNPDLRVVLTVSPVPLTATATGGHVLTATTYSKSVLRAVAGQLAAEYAYVDYFPSYEIITGVPYRAAYYEPNLRSVTPEGVRAVMAHFFATFTSGGPAPDRSARSGRSGRPYPVPARGEGDPCDDAVLDYYNAG